MSGTVPSNTVASNGTGVIFDAQANTYVQTDPVVANLRAFNNALAGMTVTLLGYVTAGDGGAGIFYYNPSATAADDGGVTTVQPNGVATGRWLRAPSPPQLPGVYNIAAYGAVAGGSVDNSTAIQNALTALTAGGGGVMYVPPGIYAFSAAITIPAKCEIIGCGAGISVLRGTTANATMFTYSAASLTFPGISFENLSFDGGAAGITAISLTLAGLSLIQNCNFTGIAYTAKLDRCEGSLVTGCNARGNASYAMGQLLITDSTDADGPAGWEVVTNYFMDCSAATGQTGGTQTTPLVLISQAANTQVNSCRAIGLNAITANSIVAFEVAGSQCQGNIFTNCYCIGASTGYLVQGAASPVGSPAYITFLNCGADQFGTAGIAINGVSGNPVNLIEITGGILTAPTATSVPCISVVDSTITGTISDVTMYQYLNYPTASGVGIQLQSADGFAITGCTFGQLATAINFVSGNSQISVTGNRSRSCTAITAGTPGTGSQIVNNGWNTQPPAPSLPTLPSTTVAYANDTGYTLLICVSGGTVSAIAVNTIVTGLTSGAFVLPPGNFNTITLTYSAAPTWEVTVLL